MDIKKVDEKTFEVLGQYFKCSNVTYNAWKPLGILRNMFSILFFAKIILAVNYFHKKFDLWRLTGFWLHLWNES